MSTARHRRQQFMQGNDSMIINTSRTAVNISSELDQIQEAAYELAETPLHKTEDQELLEPSRRITIEVEGPTPNEKKPINKMRSDMNVNVVGASRLARESPILVL